MAEYSDTDFQTDLNINAEVPSAGGSRDSLLAHSTELRRKAAKKYGKRKDLERKVKAEVEAKIMADLQNQMSVERSNREEQRQDELFFKAQETEYDELARAQPQYRDLQVPMIAPIVERAVDKCLKRNVSGRVIPVMRSAADMQSPDLDRQIEQIAKAYDLRMRYALDNFDYTLLKKEAVKSAIIVGVGYIYHGIKVNRQGRFVHFANCPNWKNVYTDTDAVQMKDANYGYVLSKKRMHNVLAMYPEQEREIRAFSENKTGYLVVDSTVTDMTSYDYHAAVRTDARMGKYEPQILASPQQLAETVNMGYGYFYDTFRDDNGKLVSVCLYCNFLVNETFERCHLLTSPEHLLGHNRIPIQRLTFEVDGDTNLPYSPLVRLQRGLQRTGNSSMRNLNRLVGSRGAILGIDSLPPAVDVHEYMHDVERRLSRAIYVLPNFSPDPNAIKVENHSEDIRNLSDTLQTCLGISSATTGTMFGNDSGNGQAKAQQENQGRSKDDEPDQFLSFHINIDHHLVKPLCEQLLSEIEQFVGMLDRSGLVMEKSKLIQLTSDGDYTIEGNSATYRIIPKDREETMTDEERMTLLEVIKGYEPQVSMAYLPLYLKTLPHGGAELLDICKEQMIKLGLPVPSGILTEQEKPIVAQLEQQRQQQQNQERQLLIAEKTSEIELKRAQANSQMIEAVKPSDDQKALEQQRTIARLEQENAMLRGSGAVQ